MERTTWPWSDRYRGLFLSEGAITAFLAEVDPVPRQVLDVGCGDGTVAVALASRYPTAQVVGVDVHPAAIEAARLLATSKGLANVRFELARIPELPPRFRRGFDLALARNVHHFLHPLADLFIPLRGALYESGGRVVLEGPACPARSPAKHALDVLQTCWNSYPPRFLYDTDEIGASAIASNFRTTKVVHYRVHRPFPMAVINGVRQALSSVDRVALEAEGTDWATYVDFPYVRMSLAAA